MITAAFTFDPADKIIEVGVSGHADTAPYGYDIVCASVSSLVLATINGLEEYAQIDSKATVENGMTKFQAVTSDSTQSTQAQAIMHTFYLAMVGLEDEYPDFIEVTVTEDN